jgi:methionyl-tRNA formyltransferase
VRVEAERRGLALLQPEKVGAAEALDWLRALAPDIGCVVAFGQFIPKPVRTLPPHGLINAHASLLPCYRGAAPIAHAILAGDPTTGISVMKVEREMDAGDVCLVRELAIGDDESTGALEERLAQLAAPALVAACDDIAAGRAVFAPQDQTRATLAPKLGRDFGKLDWSRPRAEVLRRIRAATPRPGADVELAPSGRRFRILAAAAAEGPAAAPRQVDAAESRLRLRAIDGWIEVHRLQAPGKRPVATAEYLRGARVGEDEEIASA